MSVRSVFQGLASTPAEDQAVELRAQSQAAGADAIGSLRDKELVTLVGWVRSVTLPPRGNVPALVVQIDDGTGSIDLVFLGRRSIAGLRPGQTLRASGRVCRTGRSWRMYNPLYEIVPA